MCAVVQVRTSSRGVLVIAAVAVTREIVRDVHELPAHAKAGRIRPSGFGRAMPTDSRIVGSPKAAPNAMRGGAGRFSVSQWRRSFEGRTDGVGRKLGAASMAASRPKKRYAT